MGCFYLATECRLGFDAGQCVIRPKAITRAAAFLALKLFSKFLELSAGCRCYSSLLLSLYVWFSGAGHLTECLLSIFTIRFSFAVRTSI
jgi:hypothetical protein